MTDNDSAQGPADRTLRVFAIEPGDPASSVILHVPHASRALTATARDGLLIDEAELTEELDHLTDAYTDVIARRAADLCPVRPWLFVNLFSRLVVDPERFPDEREEMLSAGMGAVYTRGFAGRPLRNLDYVRDERLLATHFHPYAEGISALVDDRLAATGSAVIVDVHSYATTALPYELHGADPRPPICLGVDDFHTPAALLSQARDIFDESDVNAPFAGCYVPLKAYGIDKSVSALMIEIRRDGYMIEPGGSPTAGLESIAQQLSRLVSGMKI